MTKFLQIVLLVVAVQCLGANGKPLFQGISFQRGFEINFKPLLRKPIAFIKEKWSPFGVFGRRHAIQRRSLEGVMSPVVPAAPIVEPRAAAPVFEDVDEIQKLISLPLKVLPPQTSRPPPIPISSPIFPPLFSPVLAPVISSEAPPISAHEPPPKPLNVLVTPAPMRVLGEVPPHPSIIPKLIPSNVPIPAPFFVHAEESIPLISSNLVIPPPKLLNEVSGPPGLFTDISRAEPVKEYINSVQSFPPPLDTEEKVAPPIETNSIRPEPPKGTNNNALIRGSKMALYFGNIFLQLMSQFMTNARATFDQMTNPPPVYEN